MEWLHYTVIIVLQDDKKLLLTQDGQT